ncbi:MAG TPA: UTP--glucose-1-phosphate uridylyltransferase, partial [Oxalicibacterium sp.]|nr:UTP--glucose-1-phosphate uridylyltransferase [Oxalicibacterium sp.]
NKRAIEDHFDKAYELETELEAAGKAALLDLVRNVIPKNVNCIYIRQPAPLGLGHAVLCARPVVGNEPFAVLLADDFMDTDAGTKPVLAQMTDIFSREGHSILAVQDVPRSDTRQYGIVSATPYKDGLEEVNAIVEKPQPDAAPSTLAVVGRYVLTGRIFDYLENIGQGAGGEIQLTDGIAALMRDQKVLAYRYDGQRYDCGSKLGYLKATVAMGLKHAETGAGFAEFVKSMK